MNALFVVLLVAIVCSVSAFQAAHTRVGVNSALKMALADYKEELAATAAKIASPGKCDLQKGKIYY